MSEDLSNFFCMDETGIWNDSVVPRSYSPIGGDLPEIHSPDAPKRNTLVATLCGDGRKLPFFFIEHTREKRKKKQVIQRAVKGMTEKLMLDYIEKIIRPNVPRGSVLLMDQLSSHKTAKVMDSLQSLGVLAVFFPPKASADLSPLDNFFFHSFKTEFRKIQPKQTTIDIIQACNQAYAVIPERTVRSCWRRCGLLSVPPPQEKLQNDYTVDFADSSEEEEELTDQKWRGDLHTFQDHDCSDLEVLEVSSPASAPIEGCGPIFSTTNLFCQQSPWESNDETDSESGSESADDSS